MVDERLTRRQVLGLAVGAAALGAVPAWAQPPEDDLALVEPQCGPLEVHLPRDCGRVIVQREPAFEVGDVHLDEESGVVTVCVLLRKPASFIVLDFNQRFVADG